MQPTSSHATGVSFLDGGSIKLEASDYPASWQRFLDSVSLYPDNAALVSMHQSSSLFSIPSLPSLITNGDSESHQLPEDEVEAESKRYLRWSYRSLKSGIERLAISLQALGIEAGMVMVTFLPNGAEYVLTKMAAHMMGCIFAPLNPASLVNEDEVNHLLPIKVVVEDLGAEPEPPPADWQRFDHLMTYQSSETGSISPLTAWTDETLLCTSGTTSLPKVCVITTQQASYTMRTQLKQQGFSSEDVVVCVAPNNHVAGIESMMCALVCGGTVVFPSARFDADAFARAANLECATYTFLVPTMVVAISRQLNFEKERRRIASLRSVSLGGSPVTRHVLQLCVDMLGSPAACPVFGSTEGAFVRTGDRGIQELIEASGSREMDVAVPVGLGAVPGQALKVCDPGDNSKILPIGGVGELHMSSLGVCSGYVDDWKNPRFYHEEGRNWYNTGDQACFDGEGHIYVLGRYKDMIIRGGENIAPAAIEAVLEAEPTLAHLGIQIVGATDEDGLAGEVVVAVTRNRMDSDTMVTVRDAVVRHMGAACAPEFSVSLEDLGLYDFPRTAVGKVQKNKLADLVARYRSGLKPDGDLTQPAAVQSDTLDQLTRIWSEAVGISSHDPSKLLPSDTQVAELPVDSIAVMRVRDRLAKALGGRTLSLTEIGQGGTIRELAVLLDTKPSEQNGSVELEATDATAQNQGPPDVDDMVHLIEDPSLFQPTKDLVTEVIKDFGLSWEKDVRDVMPLTDFNRLSLGVGTFLRLNLKTVLVTKNGVTKQQLREAVMRVIINNPLMASFVVSDAETLGPDLALHVVVNLTEEFLDKYVVGDGGVVKDVPGLMEFGNRQNYPECKDASPPGPLSKFWLFDVTETGSAGYVLNTSHTVMDATFAALVSDDLEAALTKPQAPLRRHMEYKMWADSSFVLRSSPAARAGVKYHVGVLKGLSKHRHAIWPPQSPMYLPREIHMPVDGANGLKHVFNVPGWLELRARYPEISPHIPLKAAFALFLMGKTRHTHAMFTQLEAERSRWPFVPKSMDDDQTGDYPASDVGGLTIQSIINLVSIQRDETAIAFMQRIQAAQKLQTKHASAPRRAIFDAIGPDAAAMVPWVGVAANFNWLGANMRETKDRFSSFEIAGILIDRRVFGCFLMGGMMASESGTKLWIDLHGTTFSLAELHDMTRELEQLTTWLLDESNWGRHVAGVVHRAAETGSSAFQVGAPFRSDARLVVAAA
ncbi:hypothetical protein B0T22DRAFT_386771 [Podospora appendiculata]|uniref:Carrier domain-containing protein n=1 Tax=Podospora appendiculata TaxID=314037 RepID=A0AAE0X0X8_9PEZI|nr:hypothetical protein B0T22DRAFT_386771 [Podospora appendiculata]